MAEFLVKMADERGHVLEQVENGLSERDVRDRFSQKGFLVYSVRDRAGMLSLNPFKRRRKIKHDEFIIFNQQFVTLIKAGLPILMALDLLQKRQRNPFFQSLLENVRERVKGGELLSEAFEAQGQGAISRIYTTTLLAGERSGSLEEVLNRYISYQRIAATFRKKLTSSLWYPALLMTALTVMLTFLITYVVPKFAELYHQFDAELPYVTKLMLGIGTTLQGYFYIVVPVLIGLIAVVVAWFRSEQGARVIDTVRFKLPLFGAIWMKYQVAMFSRTLSTLLAGGMPLVPSLETASSSINSRKISRNVEQAARRVREGGSLSASLEETQFFPDLAVEMIEVGESTGALPAMLNSVAEFYEEDVQNALTAAMQLIEPVLLIIMASVVAFVLISLYLPIFNLGAQIH
jgi:type IV pilus assembly protein PilC